MLIKKGRTAAKVQWLGLLLLASESLPVFKPPGSERSPSRVIRHSMNDAFVPLGTAMADIAVHVFRGGNCQIRTTLSGVGNWCSVSRGIRRFGHNVGRVNNRQDGPPKIG